MLEVREKTKEVGAVIEGNKQPEKYTYDELARIASELQTQGQKLYQENQQLKAQLQNQNIVLRLDFLFKMLDNRILFPSETVAKIVNEIDEFMFPKEPEQVAEEPVEEVK